MGVFVGSRRYLNHEAAPDGRLVITILKKPSRIARLFGARDEEQSFIGNATGWRSYPGFTRASTGTEMYLSDLESWIIHQEKRHGVTRTMYGRAQEAGRWVQ